MKSYIYGCGTFCAVQKRGNSLRIGNRRCLCNITQEHNSIYKIILRNLRATRIIQISRFMSKSDISVTFRKLSTVKAFVVRISELTDHSFRTFLFCFRSKCNFTSFCLLAAFSVCVQLVLTQPTQKINVGKDTLCSTIGYLIYNFVDKMCNVRLKRKHI